MMLAQDFIIRDAFLVVTSHQGPQLSELGWWQEVLLVIFLHTLAPSPQLHVLVSQCHESGLLRIKIGLLQQRSSRHKLWCGATYLRDVNLVHEHFLFMHKLTVLDLSEHLCDELLLDGNVRDHIEALSQAILVNLLGDVG